MALAVTDLAVDLEARGVSVSRDAPVADLTTYRIGGPASILVRVRSEVELLEVSGAVRAQAIPVIIVGRGSNLLVADTGFPGLAVVLDGAFNQLDLDDDRVRAGGAVPLPVLARRSAAGGLAGLEFYVGIPGSVGGAVRMNAGGHGRETRDVLHSARTVDLSSGTVREVDADGLDLGYRHSSVHDRMVVTAATFAVATDDPDACEARVAEVVRWRREHQPGGANAGSVFRNPPGDAAGRLIDAAGLRGLRVGGAVVSPKHANFFQADPDATAADVRGLVEEVRRRVRARFGVDLQPELRMVGFGP